MPSQQLAAVVTRVYPTIMQISSLAGEIAAKNDAFLAVARILFFKKHISRYEHFDEDGAT